MQADEAVSHLFYSLTPDRIMDAVESCGRRSTGRCLALNSFENRVYEIELEDGEFVVAKFYRPGRWSKEQILEEHNFTFELERSDIPVVSPLKLFDGASVSELQSEGIFFTVFPKRGGRIRDEFTLEDLRRLGSLVGRLHSVGQTSAFDHRVKLNIQTYGWENIEYLRENETVPIHFRDTFFPQVERVLKRSEEIGLPEETIRTHGDLHIGNILWRDERILFVDFDDAVQAPRLQDLWLLFGADDEGKASRIEAVLEGYSDWQNFQRSDLKAEHILRALRQIHFIAWYARRWSDPIFPRSFSFFMEQNYWADQAQYFALLEQKLSMV